MGIHQIQMAYESQQDRILMRLSTSERSEFRFWLTRRYVKRLWSLLRRMLERDEAFQKLSEEGRRALLGMQHESFIDEGDFSRDFEDGSRQLPLGPEPVLLTAARGKVGNRGTQVLCLYPAQGPGINVTLDAKLLHMICKLLRDAVSRSDWDVRITLLAGTEASVTPAPAASRTLN